MGMGMIVQRKFAVRRVRSSSINSLPLFYIITCVRLLGLKITSLNGSFSLTAPSSDGTMSFGVIDPDKAFSVGLGYTGAFNSVRMGSWFWVRALTGLFLLSVTNLDWSLQLLSVHSHTPTSKSRFCIHHQRGEEWVSFLVLFLLHFLPFASV